MKNTNKKSIELLKSYEMRSSISKIIGGYGDDGGLVKVKTSEEDDDKRD